MMCGNAELLTPFAELVQAEVDRWVSRRMAKAYLSKAKLVILEKKMADPAWIARQQKKARRAARRAKQGLPQV